MAWLKFVFSGYITMSGIPENHIEYTISMKLLPLC